MSFVGIEECTDQRRPDPVIRRFATERAARAWLAAAPKGFAFPGAADPTLPMGQQNFHRRIRSAYEMPLGWRLSKKAVDADWDRWRGSVYQSLGSSRIAVIQRAAIRRVEEEAS